MYGDIPENVILFFFGEVINILLEGHETFPTMLLVLMITWAFMGSREFKIMTCLLLTAMARVRLMWR